MLSPQKEKAPREDAGGKNDPNAASVLQPDAAANIFVTVIADTKCVPGMSQDDRVFGCSLREALTRDWPGDHHFTAYEPIELDVRNAQGDLVGTAPVRARTQSRTGASASDDPNRDATVYNTGSGAMHMVALIGDVDSPEAHEHHTPASDEWRADVEPRLSETGLLWYRTKGGARVIALLDTPFTVDSPERAAEWSARYTGWCESLQKEHGLTLDSGCNDVTRAFRLPRVVRDGEPTRESTHGALRRVPMPERSLSVCGQPKSVASIVSAPEAHSSIAIDAAKGALLCALGDWRQYNGSKFYLCRAVGGVLRKSGLWSQEDCADLIRLFLPSDNRNIDVDNGIRAATYCWQVPSENVSGMTKLIEHAGEARANAIWAAALLPSSARRGPSDVQEPEAARPMCDADTDGLIYGELTDSPTPRVFLVPELELGPGRPYGMLGRSNATKTIATMQAVIDLSLGRRVWSQFVGPGGPIKVLYIFYEGFRKAQEDFARILRGTGAWIDWALLRSTLRFAEGRHFLGADGPQNREWLMRTAEPYDGGLIVIDPLVAACRGLDENKTEMAGPLYDMEGVSNQTNTTFLVLHHCGHSQAERSRGHSAIEGAFGANISISKDDEEERRNLRLVTPRKMDRYGTSAFDLELQDLDEHGHAWVPTAAKRARNEVSWALRVVALGSAPEKVQRGRPQTMSADDKNAARVQAHAEAIREHLATPSPDGLQVHLDRKRAVQVSAVHNRDWPAVLSVLRRQGVQVSTSGRHGLDMWLGQPAPAGRPASFRAPSRASYHGVPGAGSNGENDARTKSE